MSYKGLTVLAASLVLSCSANRYTQTGEVRTARGAGCTFETLSSRPDRAFVELGIIEFYTPGGGSAGWAGSVAEARQRAAQFVCSAGGDAILLAAPTHGQFASATVIAFKQ